MAPELESHLVGRLVKRIRSFDFLLKLVQSEEELHFPPPAHNSVPDHCPYSAVRQNPCPYVFQMPLHYPKYSREQYDAMPEWQLDRLLEEYGLPSSGSLQEKRDLAIGSFVWKI